MGASRSAFEAAVERHRAGDLEKAASIYQDVLKRNPRHADALHLLGLVRHQSGEPQAAVELIGRAIRLSPAVGVFHANLGCVLRAQGRTADAIACFRKAVDLQPGDAAAHSNLANALRESGRAEEAIRLLERALAISPGLAAAQVNLAAALEDRGRLEEAVACLRELLTRDPRCAEALNNLGSALGGLGRLDEAEAALERALELRPAFAEARSNLGAVFERGGRIEQALACYREAIRLMPGYAEAHVNLGMALLLAGDFDEGWREYEWRWRRPNAALRPFPQPLWDGSPLAGRRILLHAEQGLGDTIHFVRYAPLVKACGGTVLLECPSTLAPLAGSAEGVDQVIASGSPLPDFDYHAPLMSLPRIFKTRLADIPARVPYLAAPSELVAARRGEIARAGVGRRRIGLCWASNAAAKNVRARSMKLADFAPLGGIAGIALFSLQRGPQMEELRDPPAGLEIIDLESNAAGALATAAAIQNLDLVISVDTMVAHLAGALGARVWTLLPFAPDFRWMLERRDTPWYPTMRLFRQRRPGDWVGVIGEVAQALRALS